jgi:hypothetical protein
LYLPLLVLQLPLELLLLQMSHSNLKNHSYLRLLVLQSLLVLPEVQLPLKYLMTRLIHYYLMIPKYLNFQMFLMSH